MAVRMALLHLKALLLLVSGAAHVLGTPLCIGVCRYRSSRDPPPSFALSPLCVGTGQTTVTIAATKANFVSTVTYPASKFDATLSGPANGFSTSDGTGGYWSCNSACSTYCANVILGYSGTASTWFTVATFPVVVRRHGQWQAA
jgi:hypothetical protein